MASTYWEMDSQNLMKTATGIYIHIPFCLRRCNYCDFLSTESQPHTDYVNAVINEIRTSEIANQVDTVYIGGGTPTALPAHLMNKLLEVVKEMPLIPGAEITVEANPGTLSLEYLLEMKAQGVNRLSIGLQATQPNLLKILGRIHTKEAFTENFLAARKAGFDNINVDLMFSLPTQQMSDWRETLREVITLSPEHISAYSLTPAEGTPLWEQLENNSISLPDDGIDRDMYHAARKMLKDAGYVHYELSNFAKPGRESKHNINCWKMRPYLGFGLGAHSFDGRNRWHNTEDMAEYMNQATPKTPQCKTWTDMRRNIQQLSNTDLMSEAMILGLRLCEGVSERDFAQAYGVTPSELYKNEIFKLIADGLITSKNGVLALTPYGMDLANQVFVALLID